MKIYFSGSIRGGRDDQGIYFELIKKLQEFGTVLTEHVGDKTLSSFGSVDRSDREIFKRDMDWVMESDVVIAEVTSPSLGVGYELARAELMKKPVLCLYRETVEKRLSAMISGNEYFTISQYKTVDEASEMISSFFKKMQRS